MYDDDKIGGIWAESSETRERGEVYNESAFSQPMLFSGMRYERNITPSDWDFFLEFNGVLFIYGEGKKRPSDLTYGQQKSLEHVCDSHNKAQNIATAFLFQHEIEAPNPIYVKDQTVVKYYWDGCWVDVKKNITVLEFIEKIRGYCKNKRKMKL